MGWWILTENVTVAAELKTWLQTPVHRIPLSVMGWAV